MKAKEYGILCLIYLFSDCFIVTLILPNILQISSASINKLLASLLVKYAVAYRNFNQYIVSLASLKQMDILAKRHGAWRQRRISDIISDSSDS